jgi:hypothetical protein
VIETGRPTAEVARDLGVNALLHRDEFGASLALSYAFHTRADGIDRGAARLHHRLRFPARGPNA